MKMWMVGLVAVGVAAWVLGMIADPLFGTATSRVVFAAVLYGGTAVVILLSIFGRTRGKQVQKKPARASRRGK